MCIRYVVRCLLQTCCADGECCLEGDAEEGDKLSFFAKNSCSKTLSC